MRNFRNLLLAVLFFGTAFSSEKTEDAVKKSCDATARILVKCMVSENCQEAASELKISLSKVNTLSEIEKERFVSYCITECNKGKLFKNQSEIVLQNAVNNEYVAIYSRCVNVLSGIGESK